MKKCIYLGLMFMLCAGMLSGCTKKTEVEESTVFVEKKGKIISVDVEKLDKDYYDAAELEAYIDEHVADYTADNGETVSKESFAVEEGIAKLQMNYDSYEEYSAFNGIEFFHGTVVEAQAEGYAFDTDFYSVSSGDEAAGAQQKAGKEEVLEDDSNKVAIIRANVDVQVKGKVLYVSAQDTEVIGKNTVRITGEGSNEEAALTYIIYQ